MGRLQIATGQSDPKNAELIGYFWSGKYHTADFRLLRYSNRAASKMLGFNPIDGLSILPIYTANIVVPHLLAICCKTIIGAKFCVNT
jgi:hypothetical protein